MDYKSTNWWKYLEEPMKDLVAQSFELLEQEESRLRQGSGEPRHDYSFVVFPIAKAYEGFLKKLLLDMRLIGERQYYGEHFRIGRALNPSLPKRYRSGWVYGKLVGACRGEELPLAMWEAWKRARNRIFHFFPDHHEFINLDEAGALIGEISTVMDKALVGCGIFG